MKKTLLSLLALMLTASMSILNAGIAHAVAIDPPVKWKDIKAGNCPGGDGKFTVLQGTAGAGSYIYAIFSVPSSHDKANKAGGTLVTKWRVGDGACIAARGEVDLGHGNDIAYHANYAGQGAALLIPKGTNSVESKSVVVLKASDLSNFPTGFTSPTNASGICYSSVAKKFAIRFKKTVYVYAETSSRTRGSKVAEFAVAVTTDVSTGGQGLDCSGSNVYDVRSIAGETGKTNYIYQYSWGGTYRKVLTYGAGATLKPTNSTSREVEGIFHIGDQFYMAVNRNSGGADTLYTIGW